MANHFTHDDLLQYIYNELPPSGTAAIEQALRANSELRSQHEELTSVIRQLELVLYQPAQRSIDKVLAFSQHEHTAI